MRVKAEIALHTVNAAQGVVFDNFRAVAYLLARRLVRGMKFRPGRDARQQTPLFPKLLYVHGKS